MNLLIFSAVILATERHKNYFRRELDGYIVDYLNRCAKNKQKNLLF